MLTAVSLGRVDNTGNLDICGGTSHENGAFLALRAKNTYVPDQEGYVILSANNGTDSTSITMAPSGSIVKTVAASTGQTAKNFAMYEDVIPRSGGQVLNAIEYARTTDDSYTILDGGTGWQNGAHLYVHGKNSNNGSWGLAAVNASARLDLVGNPNGLLQWGGVDVLRRGMHNNWSHSSSFVNVASPSRAQEDTGTCIDLGQPGREGVCGVWRGKSDNFTFVESIYGMTDAIWWYAMNNSDVDNGVNSPRKTMIWYGNDGLLSTSKVQASEGFWHGNYRIYVG